MKKLALWATAVVLLVAIGAFVTVQLRSTRTFDAPTPAIAASADPAIVSRGRYLVYSAAACAYCHVPKEHWTTLDAGTELPLSGNHVFRLPFGELFSSNLTPDRETGIGRRTDGELARILRHGVRADGRAAFPLMEFQDLTDEDLTAIISFLRSAPPVASAVPQHRLSLLGKTLMAFAIEPAGPSSPPARTGPPSPSVERGQYLATKVSSCVSCHTDRDDRGNLVGPPFGGGQRMDVAADASKVFVPPNLTPDPATSPIGNWNEAGFVGRFRAGEVVKGTPMPWGAYARMSEDDLRSIYRYLRTLPPVVHATGPAIQDR